ncbi:MAG TPA: hypothetical protein VF177_15330 [Anaerolineae bacterium]
MAEEPFDVVVVGNVGVDTNVYLHGQDIDFTVEANFTENVDYVGQAGGYSSRGYAHLGKQTARASYVAFTNPNVSVSPSKVSACR